MNIVILANGQFPTAEQPIEALRGADFVVCCDGAYAHLKAFGCDAGRVAVVGDLDSLSEAEGVEVCQVAEQESNDLTKAFRYVLARFPRFSLTLLGATGLREDHTLGNIALLADYLEEGGLRMDSFRMLTDYGVFTPFSGCRTFDSFARQQVSIFAFDPQTRITVSGLEYPIEGRCLRRWWEGTLNASLGARFSVTADDGIALVYQTFEPKV